MDNKIRPLHMLSIRDSLQFKRHTHRLKVKGCSKLFHESKNKQEKAGIEILIPDKINFETKAKQETREDLAIPLLGIYSKKPKILC